MGDSFVYESEYLIFNWAIGGVQGVITVVTHIPGRVPKAQLNMRYSDSYTKESPII